MKKTIITLSVAALVAVGGTSAVAAIQSPEADTLATVTSETTSPVEVAASPEVTPEAVEAPEQSTEAVDAPVAPVEAPSTVEQSPEAVEAPVSPSNVTPLQQAPVTPAEAPSVAVAPVEASPAPEAYVHVPTPVPDFMTAAPVYPDDTIPVPSEAPMPAE